MKKTLLLSAVFAAASMFGAETASATDVNEGFSKSVWSHWHGDKVKAKYTLNKEEGSAEKGAAQVAVSTPGSACFLKRFPVEPSSLYQVEVMTKSASPNVVSSISVQDFGSAARYVKVIGGHSVIASPEWKKITYFFRTEPKTKTVQMLLDARSKNADGAVVLFDDFKMTKVENISEFLDSFASNSWGSWKTDKSKIKFSHDPEVGKAAPGSCRIDILPENTLPKFSGCATKTLPIVPGKTYTLTVFVKAQNLDPQTRLSLSFQAQDEKCKFLGLPIPSRSFTAAECADWKQIIITRKITPTGKWEKCRNVLVTLGVGYSSNPGTAWFDDFEFFVDEAEEE